MPFSDLPWMFTAASPARRSALSLARRVAAAECSVLITGPTGVGKDVLAEDLHNHSRRAEKPFVAVNCAALSPALLESELFGHARGAYTSAIAPKPGLVEVADGGTLFLDEVGELPLEAQAKLLRFLSKGTFWPVGATKERRVDVRVLAATNRDLRSMLDASFRADLYFRLSVVTVAVPGLAAEDTRNIARVFLVEQLDGGIWLSREDIDRAADLAAAREWRGGARELKHAVERMLLLREPGQSIDEAFHFAVEGLPPGGCAKEGEPSFAPSIAPSFAPKVEDAGAAVQLFDDLVFLALAEDTRDVRELAQRLDRSLQTVYERLKRLGIKPRELGKTTVVERAAQKAREDLAPHRPWIQAMLNRFPET